MATRAREGFLQGVCVRAHARKWLGSGQVGREGSCFSKTLGDTALKRTVAPTLPARTEEAAALMRASVWAAVSSVRTYAVRGRLAS